MSRNPSPSVPAVSAPGGRRTADRLRRLLAAAVLAAFPLAGAPAEGQELAAPASVRVLARSAGPACSGPGWIVHDDGTAENGLGWDPMVVDDGIYVDRFQFGSPTGDAITEVCFRLARLGADDSLDFEVTFWSFDGPGGDPGTLLGSVPATATGVPGFPGQFYSVDVSTLGLPAQGDVGVGPRWSPQIDQDFFLLTDETVASPFTDPVGSPDGGMSWDEVVNALPNTRTTMTRVERGPDPVIFADGFESGDTSSWSLTQP